MPLAEIKQMPGPPGYATYECMNVRAQDPFDPNNEGMAPFPYHIHCYENTTPQQATPTLGSHWGSVKGGFGSGASFTVPANANRTDIVFATKDATNPDDPWDKVTLIHMSMPAAPWSHYSGFAKFLLAPL